MVYLISKIFILCLSLSVGCESSNPTETETIPLNIYMELPSDENGYYYFDYPNGDISSYTNVKYETNPITRVFWTSTDSFTIIHQGIPFTQPIVNYSTYSDDDRNGQQMVYVYGIHIGDTLDIFGYVNDDIWDWVGVVVE